MKNMYRLLLAPCLAVVMLAGCGQSGQGNAAENIETEKKALPKDSGSGEVTKAAFDKMIDDWIKRNKDKMGEGFSAKQFRLALQKWYGENKDQIAGTKFVQKDFDAMILRLMQAQSQGHGHAH